MGIFSFLQPPSPTAVAEPTTVTAGNIKPVVLIILDGWGVAPPSEGNVLTQAKTPNFDKFFKLYPHTELIASGESVGLPANEVGSTEVGHLTLGSGRVIFQGLKRINVAIQNGTFFQNEAIRQAIKHVKENNSKLHIMGLISTGNVHASIEHFYALLQFCQHMGMNTNNVFIHVFSDGRDSPPREALEFMPQVQAKMEEYKVGQFATISGRYYAMDRDQRWERIEKAYQALVEGKGLTANSIQEAIQAAYAKNLTDEQIEPTVLLKDGKPVATIDDNDAAIFFNFRIDRPRELSMALCVPDFEQLQAADFGYSKRKEVITTFTRQKKPQNFFFVTMMNYQEHIPVSAIAFNADNVEYPMAQVLSEHNLNQFHMAESEKERFVGYYFDGYHEKPYPNEDIFIIPSPNVLTYDKKPEMSTFQIADEFKKRLSQDHYHFLLMNIAAPDMVAHTGNIKATIKACEATDKAVGQMVAEVLAVDGTVFITADHGHAEKLLEYDSSSFFFTTKEGSMSTDHSNNPVPFFIINNQLRGVTDRTPEKGTLSDVVPTILTFMGLPVPSQMTGHNLWH